MEGDTSRRMRWAWHVARMVARRGAYRVLWGNLRKIDSLKNRGVDGRIIVKWIFSRFGGCGLDLFGSG
jgi:hypothetical protein